MQRSHFAGMHREFREYSGKTIFPDRRRLPDMHLQKGHGSRTLCRVGFTFCALRKLVSQSTLEAMAGRWRPVFEIEAECLFSTAEQCHAAITRFAGLRQSMQAFWQDARQRGKHDRRQPAWGIILCRGPYKKGPAGSHQSLQTLVLSVEAAIGLEPMNCGFADRCLYILSI